MSRRPVAGAAAETNGADRVSEMLPPAADPDRARCGVVGIHCENLGWLAREPRRQATLCCRNYWADPEVVS